MLFQVTIIIIIIPSDHRAKLKESENKNEFLELAKVLKTMWNMKKPVILNLIILILNLILNLIKL